MNFNTIDWGPDEAKGDSNLAHYFMKIPDYESLLSGDKRYIIGRKGTGKTALLERIRIEARTNSYYKTKDLSLRDFPLNDIRGFREKSMQDKSQFVPIWTFLIIIELCKLIINDRFASNDVIQDQLRKFLKENGLHLNGGFIDTIKILNSQEAKINFSMGNIGIDGKQSKNSELLIPIHFTKVILPLKEILNKITSPTTYFILFDELDEGYSVNDTNKRLLLLSLFRSLENMKLDLNRNNFTFNPILALRSDIFDNLADNDLNKYDDYIVRLNWQPDSKFSYSIKELVNTRIRAAHNINGHDDVWNDVVQDYDKNVPGPNKSVWRFMYTRTFERPRDIIKYLKYCKAINASEKLTFSTAFDAEINYSAWFYREIRDEIQSYLPVWKESLASLQKIRKGIISTQELSNVLISDSTISNYLKNEGKDVEFILKALFEFSIIGNLDESDRWLFKYKDFDLPWNSSRRVCVHFGIQKKLRIR